MTRLGELLEILGADPKRARGAYLESYFRYRKTPGANIARIRMLSHRMKDMKAKELRSSIDEIESITKHSNLSKVEEFVAMLVSDGLSSRREYKNAVHRLVLFYQQNPTSGEKRFLRDRIVQNIINMIKMYVDKGDFISALRIYGKYSSSWLKKSDRIDIKYYVGRAFELAGVFNEASRVYRDAVNKLYAIKGTPSEYKRNIFEVLPTPERLNLRLAAVAVKQKEYSKAFSYLKNIKKINKLENADQVEWVELAAKVSEKRGNIRLFLYFFCQKSDSATLK